MVYKVQRPTKNTTEQCAKPLGVVQILADVRLITSKVFAAQYSLRFPRIKRVRWDKSAADVQTQEDLWNFLEANRHGTGAPLLTDPDILSPLVTFILQSIPWCHGSAAFHLRAELIFGLLHGDLAFRKGNRAEPSKCSQSLHNRRSEARMLCVLLHATSCR